MQVCVCVGENEALLAALQNRHQEVPNMITSCLPGSYFTAQGHIRKCFTSAFDLIMPLQNTGFAMSSPESSPPHYHEMSQLEAEQPVSNGELEVILPREGEGSERNQASAASSSNSDEISSEGDQNNPAIQLEQVSLEESEDLDREVEAINYHSTTADTEKRGPIAIVVTPAIGEIPDKKPLTSEIPDDLFIPKTDSLSLKAAYGATTAHSRARSASPVPNVLGEEARKMASAKKVAVLVAVAAAIAVVWGVLLLPLVFYHLPEVSAGESDVRITLD